VANDESAKIRQRNTKEMALLYDTIGRRYSRYRRPDARIAKAIFDQIGTGKSILNLGAGVGAYEPNRQALVAVEPSMTMISQRSKHGAPVVRACAEFLPFKEDAFDVATAFLSIHHWSDIEKGLQEATRVTRERLVLLTWIGFVEDFWLLDYLPQIKEIDEQLFPSIKQLERLLKSVRVFELPIPHDFTDGFLCAYWRRPHAYLDEGARNAISTFSRISDIDNGLLRLREDLESGRWHQQYGHILNRESMDLGYRIVVSRSGFKTPSCVR
jgi:SAM-dependent methyltransferase